jgi:2-iminobutanoate/2-iminopropanoate deaminase
MSLKAHTLNGEVHAHSHGAAHAMEVPPNSRRLFCNGQVGARLDGVVPEDPVEQIQVIFERLDKILSAASMGFSDIVRLTVYVTDKSIFEAFFKQRKATMGNHSPPAVLLIVDEVTRVGVKIEIEAVAAKSV